LSERKIIASIVPPSSTGHTTAWPTADSYDEDFLFRLVTYPSGGHAYLGIIEDVSIYGTSMSCQKELKIRNLLSLGANGKPVPVRNAPNVNSQVRFASDTDLNTFFPGQKFPTRGYLGFLRETLYPLPFDLNNLCFANTAILAGIKHGKSHLAALLASQLHLTRKKVLVIDPTGEWPRLMAGTAERLQKNAKLDLSVSSHVVEKPEGELVHMSVDEPTSYPEWWKQMWAAFSRNDLTVLDVSFAGASAKAETKLRARCSIVYHIQQTLMRVALGTFRKTGESYGCPTCIVLEECHQFVPPRALADLYQKQLSLLLSMSTKEYRKYGSGHVFIDQSLGAISEDLQIQTFLLGATTTPADLRFLESQLGTEVALAAQRTAGGTETPSWVAYGAATPMTGIPWEIVTFKPGELAMLSKWNS
jgi:hypothetical protein